MTRLLHNSRGIVLLTALVVGIAVTSIAFSRSNGASSSPSSAQIQEQPALQVPAVPSAIQTGIATVNPLTPSPVYSPLPASPSPPTLPFPTNPMPTWTAVPIGSDDAAFLTPLVPSHTPQSTPQPEEPYYLIINAGMAPAPVEDYTRQADLVIMGTVKEVRPARWTTSDGKRPQNPWASDNRHTIFTPVLIDVDSLLKDKQARLELKSRETQPDMLIFAIGGMLGQDKVEWGSDNSNTYQVGERVVLFLKETGPLDPIKAVGDQILWRVQMRYAISEAGQVAANWHSSVPLAQLVVDIKSVADHEAP